MSLKYRVRLGLVPPLARVGRALGFSWPDLGDRLGPEVLIAQAAQIEKSQGSRAVPSLDIIFLTMLGGHAFNTSVDLTLGLAMQARGHRVRFVLCDQALPVCESKKAGQEATWEASCGKCWAFARSYLGAAGVEIIPVSSLLGKESEADHGEWKHLVDAALLKHFQVGILDERHVSRDRREAFLRAARISAQVGRALANRKPDRVIMSHGIYCTWGPAREVLNDAGIPVVTYGKAKKRQTEKFGWRDSADWWGVEAEWEKVKDQPLSATERAQVESYLQSRRDHSKDTLVYNFGSEEDAVQTRRRFNLDPAKATFTLFTNVLWDAASAQREIVFNNPVEWALETIRWFAAHPDRQLIVKVHPAEVVIGTKQPFASIVKEAFPSLPSNVRLIEPAEKVNSWSILSVTDVGLVHTSTVGMELPLEGIPVACVSRTHYRGKGFTMDVETRDEYFGILASWRRGQSDMARERELALRYAYLLFERYQLPWNVFHEPRHTDIRALRFDATRQLLENDTIQLVARSIEQRTDFLIPRQPRASS